MVYERAFQPVVWMLAAVISSSAIAQGPAPMKKGSYWRQQNIRFSDSKALVGMPEVTTVRQRSCSTDGRSYFDIAAEDETKPPELYSVAADGVARHLRRMLPQDYTSISISDFYPTDHELVSLLRTTKSDLSYSNSREEVTYWISLTDHDGAGGKLVQLGLKFKPLKIALFGTGEFVVLGWDEANLLPMLVVLKEDGTPQRFLDVDSRRPGVPTEGQDSFTSLSKAKTLAALSSAKFVPYDRMVLLTYPGTARSIQVVNSLGMAWMIPIALPSGFLLHDVLVSGTRNSLVLRAQSAEDFAEQAKDHVAEKPKQRVFEMHSHNGSLLREFLFDTPHPMALTCAANGNLTAVFEEPVADADAKASADKPAEAATHQVIATVHW